MSSPLKLEKETRLLAAMAYGEASLKDDANEMNALANVLVRQRDARNHADMMTFTSKEKTFSFVVADGNMRYKKLMNASDLLEIQSGVRPAESREGVQMKIAVILTMLLATSTIATAKPNRTVTETCIKAEGNTSQAKYRAIPTHQFFETEDEEARSVETTIQYGREEVGVWEMKSPEIFGLIYNGKRIPLSQVERLSSTQPSEFNPQLAMWGIIDESSHSYFCVTFNFEGLGQSGSFQAVRGIYLIERNNRRVKAYYAIGKVTKNGILIGK